MKVFWRGLRAFPQLGKSPNRSYFPKRGQTQAQTDMEGILWQLSAVWGPWILVLALAVTVIGEEGSNGLWFGCDMFPPRLI